MKQSRLFPPVLVSFMAVVLVGVSNLSAAVTFRDDFDSAASGYHDSVHDWGDNPIAPMSHPDEFSTFKILCTTDSVQLHWSPDEVHRHGLFTDILIFGTFYTMPDELLMLQINSQASIPDQPSEWDSDTRPTYEPAGGIIFKDDADYIKSTRTPAPGSLLLVAIGLLSLRYTRRLRY